LRLLIEYFFARASNPTAVLVMRLTGQSDRHSFEQNADKSLSCRVRIERAKPRRHRSTRCCSIPNKTQQITDRFDLSGHDLVDPEFTYMIFNIKQQFKAIEPISAKIVQPRSVNHTMSLDLKVFGDDIANSGGETDVHGVLPIQDK
jgi:hypothetical protein